MKAALACALALGGLRASAKSVSAPAAAPAAWQAFARLPSPVSVPIVVRAGEELFFIAGNKPSGPTNEVNAFSLQARTWRPRSAAPQPVAYSAAAALNGLIYTAGGCIRSDCSAPTAAAYAYDPKADFWTPLPPLPEPLYASQGAALNGRFYVFGGVAGRIHESGATARAYVFDPAERAWSRLRDMPRRRSHAAGAELGGRFILAGGCVSATPGRSCDAITAESDAYDAASDAWSSSAALPEPLSSHAAASDGARIVLAGGAPASGRTYILERGASRWAQGPSLIRPRYLPFMFSLPRGVGIFGPGSGAAAETLIESLGAPGPFVDPGAPAQAAAEPAPAVSAPARVPAPDLPPFAAPRPHAHAVVIGIERYREALPRADFAADDARSAAEYFRRVLGVPEENVALLIDDRATKSDFEKYFERWLPNRVEKGDEVYVFFSGHGAPNPKTGESYLVPFDADPTYIEQTGYPIARLYAQLSKLGAKRVLVAMDSCFSGAGGRSVIAKGARPLVTVVSSGVPRPLIVIAAAAGDQISNTYQEKRHGLFTYYFLEGLKRNGENLRASFDYLKPQVARTARREFNSDQEPQWREGK
jgi:hypothetical protein